MNVHAQTSNSLKLILLMIMTYSKLLLFLMLQIHKELPPLVVDNEPAFVPWVGFAECLHVNMSNVTVSRLHTHKLRTIT